MNVSSLQITDLVIGRVIVLPRRGSMPLEISLIEFSLALFYCYHNSAQGLDHRKVLSIEIRRKLQILFRHAFHDPSTYS
jgi:hypothetical protein